MRTSKSIRFRPRPQVSGFFRTETFLTYRIRIDLARSLENTKKDGNTITSLPEHASCKKYMMYSIIVFESHPFRPSIRKREAGVNKNPRSGERF